MEQIPGKVKNNNNHFRLFHQENDREIFCCNSNTLYIVDNFDDRMTSIQRNHATYKMDGGFQRHYCYRLLGTWAELIKSQSHTCVNSYCSIKLNNPTSSHLIEKGIKIAMLTDVGLSRI